MIPLQENQRFASVLTQQLLSSLLQGQLSVSDLLALHQAPTLGYGLYHSVKKTGLHMALTLKQKKTNKQTKTNISCLNTELFLIHVTASLHPHLSLLQRLLFAAV